MGDGGSAMGSGPLSPAPGGAAGEGAAHERTAVPGTAPDGAAPDGAAREVELKAVVDDWEGCLARVRHAGAAPLYTGRLCDRRYDTADRALAARDEMLRVRLYQDSTPVRAQLGWKGATHSEQGYKVRDEVETDVRDGAALVRLLERLGFVVVREIDREIVQFRVAGAVVRFERYPRMDDLVEVEGAPEAIERAVAALGMPRAAFTDERLRAFVERYQARTRQEPALSRAELEGRVRYDPDSA